MKKLDGKVSNAVHIKRHTRGASNEISFSVLDAAKNAQDEPSSSRRVPQHPILGAVSVFTLGRWKKPIRTPRREHGLTLSTGEFVSAENPGGRTSRDVSFDQDGAQQEPSSPKSCSRADEPRSGGGKAARVEAPRAADRSSESGSWTLPQEEVAARKSTRKRAKRVFAAFCAAAVAVACVVGVSAIARSYQIEQGNRERLADMIAAVDESYETVQRFEELVEANDRPLDQIDAEALETSLADMEGSLTSARSSLEASRTRLEGMYDALENNGDKEACNEAIAVANAGVNVIDAGRQILDEVILASSSYASAESGWTALLEGDAKARDAAQLVKGTSVESVEESVRASEAAVVKFSEAKQLLEDAEASYDVDFTSFKEYLGVRIEAQQRALESDRAYLDRDKEAASSANDAYNQLDAQAVEMAKAFSGDPPQIIEDAMGDRVDQHRSTLSADWARVDEGHVVIREYLGRISK